MKCPSCPLLTHRQALSAANLTVAGALHQPELFERAMLTRLNAQDRADKEYVLAFLAHARKHLEADYAVVTRFRL